MFDSYFPYYSLGFTKSELTAEIIGILKFGFKALKIRYIVEVECYSIGLFVIQYYTASNKNHPKKFQLMTDQYQGIKIIGTCVKIMHEIWLKNPEASFGFVGANTYNPIKKTEEPIDNTKRWRVYRHAMENYFDPDDFTHGAQPHNSSYVLLNKKIDVIKMDIDVDALFSRLYDKH